MKFLIYKLSIILFVLAVNINAQTSKIDSLKQLLLKTTEDTTIVLLLNDIAFEYANKNIDSAWFYARKAQILNNKLKNSFVEARNYLIIATLYNNEMHNDSAIYYALKALEISSENNFLKTIANSYLKLGAIYFSLDELNRAHKYFSKAQNEFTKLNDNLSSALCLSNIANIYLKRGKLDSSLTYYNKLLKEFELSKAKKEIAQTYSNIGIIWFKKGNYQEAIIYYQKALAIDTVLNSHNVAIFYINIGEAQIYLKQYKNAEKNLLKGYEIAKTQRAQHVKLSSLEYLSALYKEKGDFQKSLKYYEKFKTLSDTIFNSQKNLQLLEMQTRFEAKEKEHENKLLIADNKFKNEELKIANYTKLALSIIIIMALILIIILLRNRKKLKVSNQQITTQNETIADQNTELQRYQVLLEEKISERTDQLETALIKSTESDRLKSEFIENISHEIRTPMNAIQGFSEILAVNNNNIDSHHANIIQENIDQLLNLMDDLLELSKFKSGQYKLHITTFSLLKMLKEIKTNILSKRTILKKEHVEINFDCDDKNLPEKFTNDKNKINKIFKDLLNNALKYTDQGTIETICKFEDNNLIIIIKDTGIGIKQEKLPYIFDPFSKINIEEKRYRGTGIGLSVANSNIIALNGSIKAISSKGKGSVFTVVIPNFNKQNTLT